MKPHIKILILNWNGKKLLKPCLDSVLAIDYPVFTVMVIDNGSSDGSIDIVQQNYPKVEILALDQNYGFSGGYNRCFTQLTNDSPEYMFERIVQNDHCEESLWRILQINHFRRLFTSIPTNGSSKYPF